MCTAYIYIISCYIIYILSGMYSRIGTRYIVWQRQKWLHQSRKYGTYMGRVHTTIIWYKQAPKREKSVLFMLPIIRNNFYTCAYATIEATTPLFSYYSNALNAQVLSFLFLLSSEPIVCTKIYCYTRAFLILIG